MGPAKYAALRSVCLLLFPRSKVFTFSPRIDADMAVTGIDWTADVPIWDRLPRQYYSVHQHLLSRAFLKVGIFEEMCTFTRQLRLEFGI